MGQEALTGKAPPPMPEKASSWAIYDPFETADGKTVFVAITSDNHWRASARASASRICSPIPTSANPQRAQQRQKIMPVVTAKFAAETSESLSRSSRS